MKVFFLILVLLFTACSSSTKQTNSAEGNQYTIVCRNEMQDCFERCQELCPRGYMVVNRVRGNRVGDYTEYNVIIRCKR
jgi:hypothetical protein